MSDQPKTSNTYAERPFLFDWHENKVQTALRLLHDHEAAHRAEVVEVIDDLRKSPKFWDLYGCFTDALQVANQKGYGADDQVFMAMFARLYIAGSLQRTAVFEDVDLDGGK